MTVLFADVKGSMELAEQLDPEEWHQILDRFFAILTDGVHRFEGTVNQYTGDGIMALFGAPIAHEDHAQRACYAALQLRDEITRYATEVKRQHGVSFSTRMGLNSGEVIVGKIGDDLRMDYTAQGHTVGLAQRMESLAEPNTCYLSAATAHLVAGFFALDDLGAFQVKGVSEPVGVFELRGVGALRTRFEVARARAVASWAVTPTCRPWRLPWRKRRPVTVRSWASSPSGHGQESPGIRVPRTLPGAGTDRQRGARGRRTASTFPSCRCWRCFAATTASPRPIPTAWCARRSRASAAD